MTTKPESAKEYPLNYHSPCGCFLSLHGYDEAGDPIVETIKECPKCTSQSLKAGDANCEQCSDLRTQLEAAKKDPPYKRPSKPLEEELQYGCGGHACEIVKPKGQGHTGPCLCSGVAVREYLRRQLAVEKQRADNAERIANQIAHKLDDAKVENYRLRKALEEIRDFDGYWQSNGE